MNNRTYIGDCMAVFDKNFLTDDLEEVGTSELVCTIVDGEIVYKA